MACASAAASRRAAVSPSCASRRSTSSRRDSTDCSRARAPCAAKRAATSSARSRSSVPVRVPRTAASTAVSPNPSSRSTSAASAWWRARSESRSSRATPVSCRSTSSCWRRCTASWSCAMARSKVSLVCTTSIMALRGCARTLGSMSVSLGMPPLPPPVVAPRRASRKIKVGKVEVGGDAPVSVQSMTTTPTTDINATLQQIAELTASGCDIVRVACPTQDDAEALPAIAHKSQIPVIADIHFQPKYVFAAIDAGCAAVRVNPGNIRAFDDQVKQIAQAAKDAGVSIRIGVNAGSLDPRLLEKYGKPTAEALVESAVWEASLFEEHDFHDFKISVKHNDPIVMVRAYELLSERGDWPLHLGVTEAGPAFQGTIKSATAFGALLSKGIGDTIRVSLSAPPVEEVKVGIKILESLNLRPRHLEIVSCPSCGRAQVMSTSSPMKS